MTRLLAFADTQLGVATVDLADQRDVLDRIVQVALDRQVDAVLHGGDVFEGPVVTPAQLRCFVDAMRPLREHQIPLFVIRGNGRHDMAVRDVHALDILREVDGIQIADSPTVAVLADKVAVCALPWVHPGRLIASMNGSLTHDEADRTTAQMLVRIAAHLREGASRIQAGTFGAANLPTVLLAHWAISGSAIPSGLPVDEMREPVLPWAELDALGYDAVIGAHIHEPQQISNPELDQTLGIVCGSPQQLNFGEHGDHGCWIIELYEPNTHRAINAWFEPIKSRQFVTVDLDADQLAGDVLDGAGLFDITDGDIVRARYTASEETAAIIDHDHLRAELLEIGASRVQIEPNIIRKERARAQQISEQLTPIDALAAYCDAQEISPDRALAMLARLKEWEDA